MELLSKMNTKVMSWQARVDGHGIDHLSGNDLAAALAKIKGDDSPSIFMRAKYCHDAREARKLIAHIGGAIITSTDIPQKYHTQMARLVFETALAPPLCPLCRGTKEVKVNDLVIVCKRCEGSGITAKTDSYMATFLNCTKSEWQNKLEADYCTLMSIVDRWEHLGRQAILNAVLFE